MDSEKKTKEFYDKLKTQLYDTSLWPTEYLYKFIVKSGSNKVEEVETIFNNLGAVINTTESKNGNYISISISVKMKNPEQVIEKYIEVSEKVEGVISL
ncbi:DUF493 family protein [Formosa maritima]|uniref:DUF493 domain-containing protein n=1 Tax=Formosa maritima TaxID=2592046 RepID=A0A5D0G6W4_9FLAO|nr:DUF493 family protein [Formosa maritima]TYA54360.1 DUF493 domain-containing protein [Formosa maritima]